jgi:thioredoxin reductase (NADPH)
MANKIYDLIIIGAGPAGYTASIYASRYKLKNLVIGKVLGGTVVESWAIENYPGVPDVNGIELMDKFKKHTETAGGETLADEIVGIVPKGSLPEKKARGFLVTTRGGKRLEAKALVLAMGTEPKKLNLPGEKELIGKGITYCATCDAPLFKNKTVGVVGGGDSALTAVLQLSDFGCKVYLIHRGASFRGEPIWVEKVMKDKKIIKIFNTNITEVKGKEKLEEIKLDKKFKGSNALKLNGLFIEIGNVPSIALIKNLGVEIDEKEYIKIGPDCSTNVKGVWAAGDITSGSNYFRQIITASAEGAISANAIYKFIKKQ